MSTDVTLLDVVDVTPDQDLPAGSFGDWLALTRSALTSQTDADVPCGECTACCRSSYFIHIGADEIATLARIPKELQFPAPGQPNGNVLLGYDQRGHCPMLVSNRCSIYAQRPVTCRTYDCRVFPAAGISSSANDKPLVAEHAARWQFDYATERERTQHAAIRATARFLQDHANALALELPGNATQLAILAIKVHEVFLDFHDGHAATGAVPSDEDIVSAIRWAAGQSD